MGIQQRRYAKSEACLIYRILGAEGKGGTSCSECPKGSRVWLFNMFGKICMFRFPSDPRLLPIEAPRSPGGTSARLFFRKELEIDVLLPVVAGFRVVAGEGDVLSLNFVKFLGG